ncbi:MAG: CapA family protein [Dysgonamonadaceae bacterium]|nr:CapA family protein [Dysgonamonadaceae bacterium]
MTELFKLKIALIIIGLVAFTTLVSPVETVSIVGVGDIMLGSNYPSDKSLPVNDGKFLLKNVKEILQDADVTFGNLEGCFLNSGGTPKPCKNGCYFFRMPERYVDYLLDAGFDVMNIANNHMGDFGPAGRENTVKILKNAGLAYAGLKDVCETAVFERNGVKYGFCGFAPNTGTVRITDIEYAKKLVSGLDSICDIVIVSFHGGAEGKNFNRVPKKTETFYGENRGNVYEFAHAVIDAGADVVFGHGPHVLRAAELYKDRFIIYSMGNFCTSGTFSISGISGYAPMVKVTTDKTGKFISGQLFSGIQRDKTGPVLDEKQSAAKEIERLTKLDFPKTPLIFRENGEINTNFFHLPDSSSLNVESDTLAAQIIEFSKQYLGMPYRRGSKGPNSFDCSGFTHYVYKHFGYRLGASCREQINEGEKVDKENLKPGDLIFFKGRNSKAKYTGHVGIVISNESGSNLEFIHASGSRGIKIEELEKSDYYKLRYITGLRILKEGSRL